jgi:hypothetical protein
VWSSQDDWRKPLSKTEANTLRSRVTELERQVDDYREQLAAALGSEASHADSATRMWEPSASGTQSQSIPLAARPSMPLPASSSFERCFAVDTRPMMDISPTNPSAATFPDDDDVEEIMVSQERAVARAR